jgi:hypothetical protein
LIEIAQYTLGMIIAKKQAAITPRRFMNLVVDVFDSNGPRRG